MVKWKMDTNFPLNIVEGNRKGGVVNYYETSFVVGIWSSCRWPLPSPGTHDLSEHLVPMMHPLPSCSAPMGPAVCPLFSPVPSIALDPGMVPGPLWFLVAHEHRNDKLAGGPLELRVFSENFHTYWPIQGPFRGQGTKQCRFQLTSKQNGLGAAVLISKKFFGEMPLSETGHEEYWMSRPFQARVQFWLRWLPLLYERGTWHNAAAHGWGASPASEKELQGQHSVSSSAAQMLTCDPVLFSTVHLLQRLPCCSDKWTVLRKGVFSNTTVPREEQWNPCCSCLLITFHGLFHDSWVITMTKGMLTGATEEDELKWWVEFQVGR